MPSFDPILEPTPPGPRPDAQGQTSAASGPIKLCLLVVFNHRFEANLPKLDRINGGHFEHIRYLVPFYRGDRPDVIATYHGSYQFQGYYLEAWRRLKSEGFTHFLVVADDMVLNPTLNDKNFFEALGLGTDTGYLKSVVPLGERSLGWFPTGSALVAAGCKSGVNWEKELPAADVAAANLAAKGFPMRRLGWHTFQGGVRAKGFFQFLFYMIVRVLKRRRDPNIDLLTLPYPLLSGNSDIMVIPAKYMDKFCFYCSVFAAMGMFVEVAVPTALGLVCPSVVTEDDIAWTAMDWYLGNPDIPTYEEFCRQQDHNLENLFRRFGERTLLLHPVKLSQWHFPPGVVPAGDQRGAASPVPV